MKNVYPFLTWRIALLYLTVFTLVHCTTPYMMEKQITFDLDYNHDLDNNDNFSPDDAWLVYDTRTPEGGIAVSSKIEKVHLESGKKVVLYELAKNQPWGPGAGAVSYSHNHKMVVFIRGLMNAREEYPYAQWRRTGIIVNDERPGIPVYMDARDILPPFTPGALRGGTHRHEFSYDGQWVGYTYNDAIMEALERQSGQKKNLRTIGVSKKGVSVEVPTDESGENNPGEWFSVLVVHVVPEPTPGSDEISHAAADSWIGHQGYTNSEGKKQIARSFLGTVRNQAGKGVQELFVVDIPADIHEEGELGPLEGTELTMPAPPAGAVQRRLTYTAEMKYPGCKGITRSNADGSLIAYLAYDENGILQVFLISPLGGKPQQLTWHTSDVGGSVRWHPDGDRLVYVWDNSIVLCRLGDEAFEKRHNRLTDPVAGAPSGLVWSHNGKTLAFNRDVINPVTQTSTEQIFVLQF
ncbi:MAG: DUF3748 domain-containing protein [Cyclobacteriaceae bacterium]|nr:DUF3748 domain-containing protein [Cyclobacteriaceae bacterium]